MKNKSYILGKVIRIISFKSIIVLISYKKKHPLYKKIINKTTKVYVHCNYKNIKIGNIVHIIKSKPISKTKFWRIINIQ